MRLGYNTNGFAHHKLTDTLVILGELGYQSVAITLDHFTLNPFEIDPQPYLDEVRGLLEEYGLRCVIETGARFLLDPYRKHRPTLLEADSDERAHRFGMLLRAVEFASRLGADAVSFWSGVLPEGETEEIAWRRLIDSCQRLADHAGNRGVRLAFEPEPGMLVATTADFGRLHQAVHHPSFGLTLDVGHVHCLGEGPIPNVIRLWREVLWNVHIEDMSRGVHDHLMFGEGEMQFEPIASALREIGYAGGVHVELSRHSHDAVNVAGRAKEFLAARGFGLPPTPPGGGASFQPTDSQFRG